MLEKSDPGNRPEKKQNHHPVNQKKKKNVESLQWALRIFFVSIALSAVLSLLSNRALDGAGLLLAFSVLAAFIALGIVFDVIGVAVTAADPKPFHSMASHKEKGAKEALKLLKNANKVSSFCNDVVGDICGIVSGTTAAVIVVELQKHFSLSNLLLSLGITALASGLTIGGKALGKTFAIEKSTKVVHTVGRAIAPFCRKR